MPDKMEFYLTYCWWGWIGEANSGNHYVESSKSKINLPYDPAIPFLGICIMGLLSYLTVTCSALFTSPYTQ